MKKAYIQPRITLYQMTETSIMTSSNKEWHLGDFDPPHGGIFEEDEDEETL